MNTTEQTSDPTLWRYPSLWSANRTIHLRNLEVALTDCECYGKQADKDLVALRSQLEEARCLLAEQKNRDHSAINWKNWFDRRDAWLSAHTPTGKEK